MNFTRLPLPVALALALVGCSRPGPKAGAELPAVSVRTAVVQRATRPSLVETSGTVRAVQRAAIAARVAGSIASLPVTLGQPVREGDILLTLSAVELAARLAQVRAQVLQNERELALERTLQATGAGTAEAVRTLEDRLARSQAALREAETLHDYATVRAPFAGTIARKYVEIGDFAAPGVPLLQLDGSGALEIEVGVPESVAPGLTVGASLDVMVSAPAARFQAKVAELSASADPATRTITAKLAVPPGAPVHAGEFARVLLPGAPVVVLLVPSSTISQLGQMERVFAVTENNRASLRLVKTGATGEVGTEISSGVAAAERVVIAPPATLRDGQPLILAP